MFSEKDWRNRVEKEREQSCRTSRSSVQNTAKRLSMKEVKVRDKDSIIYNQDKKSQDIRRY